MSERSKQEEPAKKPALIPPLNSIIEEGSKEIGAQARAAVQSIMTKGGFADSTQLRKWGPSGAKYFLTVLQRRMAETSRLEQTAPATAGRASGRKRSAPSGAKQGKTKATERSSAPVTLDRHWTDQQCNRWSVRTRAVLHGILIAATLIIGAAMIIRTGPTLVAVVQQQTQNRR
jgi:hypothetical protein